MPSWMWFRSSFLVLVIGSVIGYLFNVHVSFLLIYGSLLGFGGLLFLFWKHIEFRFIIIVGMIALVGFFRGSLDFQDKNLESMIVQNPRETFFFDGEVISESRLTAKVQIIPVLIKGFRNDSNQSSWQRTQLRIKIITHHGRIYHEYDHIRIECIPQVQKSYGIKGIFLPYTKDIACFYSPINRIEKGEGLGYFFAKWRTHLTTRMSEVVSSPTAGYLAGILFGGGDELISKHTKEVFQKTGTSHILAISGYNVSLVCIAFFWLFRMIRIPRKRSVLIAILAIFAFVFFTGAHAPSLRAAGMASAVLGAHFFGRQSSSLFVLLCVAGGMIFFSPATFLFDAGFHLSFLATLGLIGGLSNQEYMPSTFRTSAVLLIKQTLLAIGITTPYVFFVFGTISLISPLVNVLVVPFVPLLMMASMAVVCVALSGNPLWLSWIPSGAQGMTTIWMSVIEWFSHLPFASVLMPQTPYNGVLLYCSYLCMGLGVWVWKQRKRYDRINQSL